MTDAWDACGSDLDRFAAAVAHELRTPLTAVAGEIEVALRRHRSAEEYREILRRVAAGVSELVAISGDLALLSNPAPDGHASHSMRLDDILIAVHDRYAGTSDVRVSAGGSPTVRVVGDGRLARAVTLVIEHAVRHRRPGACVSVRAMVAPDRAVTIEVDAAPIGFWPPAWCALTAAGDAIGPLRLRTARRILRESGATLALARGSGSDVVHIQLRAAD